MASDDREQRKFYECFHCCCSSSECETERVFLLYDESLGWSEADVHRF